MANQFPRELCKTVTATIAKKWFQTFIITRLNLFILVTVYLCQSPISYRDNQYDLNSVHFTTWEPLLNLRIKTLVRKKHALYLTLNTSLIQGIVGFVEKPLYNNWRLTQALFRRSVLLSNIIAQYFLSDGRPQTSGDVCTKIILTGRTHTHPFTANMKACLQYADSIAGGGIKCVVLCW